MRYLLPLAAAALMALAPLAASAETPPRTISVSGEAELRVPPDQATVSLGVQAEAATTGAAMDTASAATAAILASLAGLGIDAADIQTGGIRLTPRYGSSVLGVIDYSKIESYAASNTLRVTVRDLNALGAILAEVVGVGANTLNEVTFGLQDPTETLDRARADAVAEARRRAALYAAAAGVTLGDLLSLNDNGASSGPLYDTAQYSRDASLAGAPEYDVPVAPGEIVVTANVGLVYLIGE